MLFQVTLNGLALGGLYTLMGTGFSLQWGISGIINLAYGGFLVLGAYIAFVFFKTLGVQPILSTLPAAAVLFVLGLAVYHFLLRPTIRRGSFVVTLVMCFAIELVLENVMLLVWASDYRMITSPYSNLSVQLLGARLPLVKVVIFFASLVFVYLVHLFMSRTKTGKAIQASALNPTGAEMIGVDVQRMYTINFGLGAAIAGVAGALMSNISTFSVVLTGSLLGKVFVIAILGGLGNIWGALLGGITLGLVESYGAITIGPEYNEAIGLAVMVLVLVLRPRGLIGRKYWEV